MNRKLRDVVVLVAACLILIWCVPAVGQVLKGSMVGTVADQQGAILSGAQVKTTELATGETLTATTDSSGTFRFNLITAGSYKLEISAPHFKTQVENDIVVVAGSEGGMGTIKLSVGETSTTVEVTGAAPLIDPTALQVTNAFSGAVLQSFAGIQENQGFDNLALFVPGVASVRDNSFSNHQRWNCMFFPLASLSVKDS